MPFNRAPCHWLVFRYCSLTGASTSAFPVGKSEIPRSAGENQLSQAYVGQSDRISFVNHWRDHPDSMNGRE
jgi:hypothetical protein